MTTFVRLCPGCGDERPSSEVMCESTRSGAYCGWLLTDVPVRVAGQLDDVVAAPPVIPGVVLECANGHVLEPGDQLCLVCGAGVAGTSDAAGVTATTEVPGPTAIDDWTVLSRVAGSAAQERFIVASADGSEALLTWYAHGKEPDPAVHTLLRTIDRDHVPELRATGRWQERAYEVSELIGGCSLADAGWPAARDAASLRRVVDELGRALAGFAEVGLRHRDLNPQRILLRSVDPLDLVITGFGSARLSDFDLDDVAPLEITLYSSPEAVVGGVSAASDWWSLGVILLEQLTRGACFHHVNPKAFQIHVVTRGLDVPADLDASARRLLLGLLQRNPLRRWQWPQVQCWLEGRAPETTEDEIVDERPGGPSLPLGGRPYSSPAAWSLAAAEATHWDEAQRALFGGAVATWLESRGQDARQIAAVRRLAGAATQPEDARHALALMQLNPDLPLILRGDLITPAWLLAHPDEGYALVTGDTPRQLAQLQREPWLVRLSHRAQQIRERARLLEVQLDEARVRVLTLATSRANLEVERTSLRRIYPDSELAGVAALLENDHLTDEELIVLVAAAPAQFTPLATVLDQASRLAQQMGVTEYVAADATDVLIRPRRELYAEVDARIAGFARCGQGRLDEWADAFRVERRMTLARVAVLLALPAARWVEPPKQQYVAALLEHFEKRVVNSVQHGPLVRFTIGKTTPRVDFLELDTAMRPAAAMLEHLLRRADMRLVVDPSAFAESPALQSRLRRLASHALTFKRDTGIDGRYLGFPFLLFRDQRLLTAETKPRLAPVLLWPITLEVPAGVAADTVLGFDREREEVRLNPALEGLLEPIELEKWQRARDEILGRHSLRVNDVIDVLGSLAASATRTLQPVPSRDVRLRAGERRLVCCAALFNAEFAGQSISEDLRQMRRRPIEHTALDVAMRATAPGGESTAIVPDTAEQRFLTVESDPSQERAVARSRQAPGLLVEGPPGTGKSQTIVNVVADCLGRHQSVLVICQKQAALKVVQKRLEAEGLGGRILAVTDVISDRKPILQGVREQLESRTPAAAYELAALRRQRELLASRINNFERELDAHHRALHVVDEALGLSYRDLLTELIGIEAAGVPPSVPALRSRFASFDGIAVSDIEDACAPLSRLWLAARFEASPLSVLKEFQISPDQAGAFVASFDAFVSAETERARILTQGTPAFETDAPEAMSSWMARHAARFESMDTAERERLGQWLDWFQAPPGTVSQGASMLQSIAEVLQSMAAVDASGVDRALLAALAAQSIDNLAAARDDAAQAARPVNWWQRFSLKRIGTVRRSKALLLRIGQTPTPERHAALHRALQLEIELRQQRKPVDDLLRRLQLRVAEPIQPEEIEQQARRARQALEPVSDCAAAIAASPFIAPVSRMAKAASLSAFQAFTGDVSLAVARYQGRARSLSQLGALTDFFPDEWIDTAREAVAANEVPALESLAELGAALPTVAPFQQFRLRARGLSADAKATFIQLRPLETSLLAVAPTQIEVTVRRILRREALLGWKSRLESTHGALLTEREELETKIGKLSELEASARDLNRRLLAQDVDGSKLGAANEWDAITRHTGPRRKTLREFLNLGGDLGLRELRPIWLMSPDTASSALPLQAGMFDLVIYDEASQLLVEYAVPTLFRGKRVLISGDDKQMPPTAFFSSRSPADEEDLSAEGIDDLATESEREEHEQNWNRREIKDCPDLLSLGRTCLPVTMLQIHYRSRYRELISFSNAAYYRGELSVPARHPDAVVARVRPIEVVRVDGVYEAQTNAMEAARVVQLLAQLWVNAAGTPPSVGVVTFNLKQADLVEEAIDQHAAGDPAFAAAYARERQREQNGEDMGFFVKNVENVQGDERDVIIFSTTFGRDARGAFRRAFGVLGQTGGERRLNVAVTRARDKVMLVTSMPIAEISDMLAVGRAPAKARDYLQGYLDYASQVSGGALESARAGLNRYLPKSNAQRPVVQAEGFAAIVAAYLDSLGHRPQSAEDGGAFGVNLAVTDPVTGLFCLAIECDSPTDRHGHLDAARAREVWRPKALTRAIPHLHRVSSRAWYHDGDEERRRLRTAMESAMRTGVVE